MKKTIRRADGFCAKAHGSAVGLSAWERMRAFTLVEVLATLVLLGIVLPVTMRGVSLSLAAADSARRTSRAATLGESKLNELVTSGDYTSANTGDFAPDFPDYRWSVQTNQRDFDMNELVLNVTWTQQGIQRSMKFATMVAVASDNGTSGAASGGATSGGTTSGGIGSGSYGGR